jgi:hypothetical protein
LTLFALSLSTSVGRTSFPNSSDDSASTTMTHPVLTGQKNQSEDEKEAVSLDSLLSAASPEAGQVTQKAEGEDVFGDEENAGIKYKTNGWLQVSPMALSA